MVLNRGVRRRGTLRSRLLAEWLIELGAASASTVRMVEIGADDGDTAAFLLRKFKNLISYLIDPYEPYEKIPQAAVDASLLTMLEQTRDVRWRRRAMLMPSTEAYKVLKRESFDLVFVDGEHTYEGVRSDSKWYQRVRPGGIYCGHDYGVHNTGVTKAVDEFAAALALQVRIYPDKECRCNLWRLDKPQ